MSAITYQHVSRRTVLKGALGATAALTLPGVALLGQRSAFAQQAASQSAVAPPLPGTITRRIGKTSELVPALGLGTFLTFDVLPGQQRDHLREVVRCYWEAGVRVLDTSPLYGSGETTVGDFATGLGISQQLFIANKIWSTGEFLADESHALRSFENSQQRMWRSRFDLMQCHSVTNVDMVVPILNAWKKEGRTRYVGVTHHENDYHAVLASWIERSAIDFVQVNYSIANRSAEDKVFAAAQSRGTGVLINMAMEKGRLHKVVGDRPLPDFAREIGAENWAQFFLKFVMSHPAVTCCLSSTSTPAHAAQNVGALRGALPDRALRERMVRHMETIPGFSQIATMPWYPDKQQQYQGLIRREQAALRARA